jgi:hypothetical protein
MVEDVERILANWIEMALSPTGQLPPDVPPSRWIAEKFIRWWRSDFESHLDEDLGDAERALGTIRDELMRLGGWENFGEALHECIHLGDALGALRSALLPTEENSRPH